MKRYLTRGTNDQIPIDIQFFCWQCYEDVYKRQTLILYEEKYSIYRITKEL